MNMHWGLLALLVFCGFWLGWTAGMAVGTRRLETLREQIDLALDHWEDRP